MESGDSSSFGLKNRAKKTDRVRRAWTPVEESILADVMKELVALGWRSENGFKPGYLLKLEAGMQKRLPGTDIRWNPHINSRLTIWKKTHGSLLTMMKNNSGIGFNWDTGMIDCHDEQWKLILKSDPNAIHMRYKAWPLLADWNEIFGVDKANGGNAEDVKEATNVLGNEDISRGGENNPNPSGVDGEEGPVDMEVTSDSNRVNAATGSKNIGKKRMNVPVTPTDKLCDVLLTMNTSSDLRMESLVRVMGYDASMGNTRKELFAVMEGIPDISDDDKVDAGHILAKNPECLEWFMGMGNAARARYVRRLLSGILKV